MKKTEHEGIHLKTDLYNYVKLIAQNSTKYPFQIGRGAVDLQKRMEKQYNIKGNNNE